MTLTQFLEAEKKEFEKEFFARPFEPDGDWGFTSKISPYDMRVWLSSHDQRLIGEMVKMCEKEKCEVPPTPKNLKLTIGDADKCVLYAGRFNYNKAIDDIKSLLTEAMK